MEARNRALSIYIACLLLACAVAMTVALTVGVERAPAAEGSVTLVGAGDIASCDNQRDEATARLLGNISGTVFTLGDNVYPSGSRSQFRNCYDPSWGKYKKRTRPSTGNHDYYTADGQPYFDYFGARAGSPNRGYYSYDRGAWHIVALNSNCDKVGGCGSSSQQVEWLRNDLDNNTSKCTLAYWHHPLFASGTEVQTDSVKPFWNVLYNHDADVVLSGHAHRYERFAPQTPDGVRSATGIRQFIVGTGGMPPSGPTGESDDNSQVENANTPGVLRLTLRSDSYSWKFVPIAGKTFTDSGTDTCS